MSADVYSDEKPHPCERLARLEGEASWYKNLAGIEECTDMTGPMGALSFGRRFSETPMESLELQWGASRIHLRPIVYLAVDLLEGRAKRPLRPAERIWMVAAARDAAELVRGCRTRGTGATVPPIMRRAKQFRIDHVAYAVVRSAAKQLIEGFSRNGESAFERALLRRY